MAVNRLLASALRGARAASQRTMEPTPLANGVGTSIDQDRPEPRALFAVPNIVTLQVEDSLPEYLDSYDVELMFKAQGYMVLRWGGSALNSQLQTKQALSTEELCMFAPGVRQQWSSCARTPSTSSLERSSRRSAMRCMIRQVEVLVLVVIFQQSRALP
jgi:hypothetical protein